MRRTGYTTLVALVDDSYLFADFVVGQICRLEPNATGGGYVQTDFVTGMGAEQRYLHDLRPLRRHPGALLRELSERR